VLTIQSSRVVWPTAGLVHGEYCACACALHALEHVCMHVCLHVACMLPTCTPPLYGRVVQDSGRARC
jgi:hypothetical protein